MIKQKYKILAYFFTTTIIVLILTIFFKNNIFVLIASFFLITLLYIYNKDFSKNWKFSKYWFKFAIFLIVVFIISGFIICNKISFNSCVLSKIKEGLNTSFLLLNTVFILELFISSITVNDILSFNINIKYLKYFIFMRTLITQSVAKFNNEKILFDIIPSFQKKRNRWNISSIKPIFVQNIIYSITIIIFVLEQRKILAPLIENRIKHLYN